MTAHIVMLNHKFTVSLTIQSPFPKEGPLPPDVFFELLESLNVGVRIDPSVIEFSEDDAPGIEESGEHGLLLSSLLQSLLWMQAVLGSHCFESVLLSGSRM